MVYAKCIKNVTDDGREHHLAIGATYVVFGCGVINSTPVLLVEYDNDYLHPMFLPMECFFHPEGSFPEGFAIRDYHGPHVRSLCVLPPCFLEDYFYDRLTDGEPEAVATWLEFKQKYAGLPFYPPKVPSAWGLNVRIIYAWPVIRFESVRQCRATYVAEIELDGQPLQVFKADEVIRHQQVATDLVGVRLDQDANWGDPVVCCEAVLLHFGSANKRQLEPIGAPFLCRFLFDESRLLRELQEMRLHLKPLGND